MNRLIDWQPIESAPKDGSVVWVRRVYEGRVVAEGEAVFAVAHEQAPQRQSLGIDPLGRLSAADYEREAIAIHAHAERPKWLRPDRMYSFPTPTEWARSQSTPDILRSDD